MRSEKQANGKPVNAALLRAIHVVGGPTNLARKISVSKEFVYQMQKGLRPVPPGQCRDIESVSGVTRYELRPDVFGPQPVAPAQESP